jgi:hypothetical protein
MKICMQPTARQSRESSERYRRGRQHDGARVTTPSWCREVVRENRVNQSGSVALSTEALRRPPLAQLIDKNGVSDSKVRATNQEVVGNERKQLNCATRGRHCCGAILLRTRKLAPAF